MPSTITVLLITPEAGHLLLRRWAGRAAIGSFAQGQAAVYVVFGDALGYLAFTILGAHLPNIKGVAAVHAYMGDGYFVFYMYLAAGPTV